LITTTQGFKGLNVVGDFEELLEDQILHDLNWVKEEFEFLFKFKNNTYTKNDIALANNIIDNLIKSLNGNISDRLVDLLSETIEGIERTYPGLI
jgi:hypothetical protein